MDGMTRNVGRAVTRLGQSLLLILWATLTAIAQSVSTHADWPTYGGDLSSTRYSPLDQIGAANFNKLEVAWRVKTRRPRPPPRVGVSGRPPLGNRGVLSTPGAGPAPPGGGGTHRA